MRQNGRCEEEWKTACQTFKTHTVVLMFRFLVSSLLQKEGSSLEALVEEMKVPWRQGTGRMKRMEMKRNGMKRCETE